MTTSPARGRVPSDTFGNRLAIMRHELGLTLEEAADQAGLKRATWRTWELGTAKPRDMARVVTRISETFYYDPMWLMWGGPLGAADNPDGTTPGRPDVQGMRRYPRGSVAAGDDVTLAPVVDIFPASVPEPRRSPGDAEPDAA